MTRQSKQSAGLLMVRPRGERLEVLLVHPGGPFWSKRDAGAWTIPKGEFDEGEDPLDAARREFEEETGVRPEGRFRPLGCVKQKAGKVVHAWAFEGDCDPAAIRSSNFTLEWPPRSGRMAEFPEVDRAEFFGLDEARRRINPAQAALLDEVERVWRQEGADTDTRRFAATRTRSVQLLLRVLHDTPLAAALLHGMVWLRRHMERRSGWPIWCCARTRRASRP
jgi:predicted NUDIX family NTP pyrophosphohydrolase